MGQLSITSLAFNYSVDLLTGEQEIQPYFRIQAFLSPEWKEGSPKAVLPCTAEGIMGPEMIEQLSLVMEAAASSVLERLIQSGELTLQQVRGVVSVETTRSRSGISAVPLDPDQQRDQQESHLREVGRDGL